jgi:3-oxoacyl-[acyl-carrier protein] reductase
MTLPLFMGRVAVITGGPRGLGAAACRLLAAGGAQIAAISANATELQELLDELRWEGTCAIGVVADCGDPAALAEARDRVVAELGQPYLVICVDGDSSMVAKAFAQVTTLSVAGGSSYL